MTELFPTSGPTAVFWEHALGEKRRPGKISETRFSKNVYRFSGREVHRGHPGGHPGVRSRPFCNLDRPGAPGVGLLPTTPPVRSVRYFYFLFLTLTLTSPKSAVAISSLFVHFRWSAPGSYPTVDSLRGRKNHRACTSLHTHDSCVRYPGKWMPAASRSRS